MAQPDLTTLLEKMNFAPPLIVGLYDAPDPEAFAPLVTPKHCMFSAWEDWNQGKTVHLTEEKYGCPGASNWVFGKNLMRPEQFVNFLCGKEGLKATPELMEYWIETTPPYEPENGNILIGPLREEFYQYLKTATFFVPPDQLSFLLLGVQYFQRPEDPEPAMAPFGSGCGQLLALFPDLGLPQAIIGATDIAMRQYIPPEILALTVTKPMLKRLGDLDENSFMNKAFWKRLIKAREKGAPQE